MAKQLFRKCHSQSSGKLGEESSTLSQRKQRQERKTQWRLSWNKSGYMVGHAFYWLFSRRHVHRADSDRSNGSSKTQTEAQFITNSLRKEVSGCAKLMPDSSDQLVSAAVRDDRQRHPSHVLNVQTLHLQLHCQSQCQCHRTKKIFSCCFLATVIFHWVCLDPETQGVKPLKPVVCSDCCCC